jgi:hypothetical protein
MRENSGMGGMFAADFPYYFNKSGRFFLVMAIDCSRRHLSIWA